MQTKKKATRLRKPVSKTTTVIRQVANDTPTTKKNVVPTKYHTNVFPNLSAIQMYIRDGISEEELSKKYDIAYSTWRNYKKRYPEFNDALADSKDNIIASMEKALFKKAIGGYEIIKIKETRELDKILAELVLVKTETTIEIAQPDSHALLRALGMLSRDKWASTNVFRDELDEASVVKNIELIRKIVGDDDELS